MEAEIRNIRFYIKMLRAVQLDNNHHILYSCFMLLIVTGILLYLCWCSIPWLDGIIKWTIYKFSGSISWYFHFSHFSCFCVECQEIILILLMFLGVFDSIILCINTDSWIALWCNFNSLSWRRDCSLLSVTFIFLVLGLLIWQRNLVLFAVIFRFSHSNHYTAFIRKHLVLIKKLL